MAGIRPYALFTPPDCSRDDSSSHFAAKFDKCGPERYVVYNVPTGMHAKEMLQEVEKFYYCYFGGAAAAVAIIAGVAVVVQGIAKKQKAGPLSSRQLRGLLSDLENGTPVEKVGVMPNLKTIISKIVR